MAATSNPESKPHHFPHFFSLIPENILPPSNSFSIIHNLRNVSKILTIQFKIKSFIRSINAYNDRASTHTILSNTFVTRIIQNDTEMVGLKVLARLPIGICPMHLRGSKKDEKTIKKLPKVFQIGA